MEDRRRRDGAELPGHFSMSWARDSIGNIHIVSAFPSALQLPDKTSDPYLFSSLEQTCHQDRVEIHTSRTIFCLCAGTIFR